MMASKLIVNEDNLVPVPDYKRQKEIMEPLLAQELVRGDEWYLVDYSWLKKWKKYTGYDDMDQTSVGKENANPGPIDNADLFKNQTTDELKHHLMEEHNYSLIPKPAYDILVGWYGLSMNSRHICRYVVEFGTYQFKNLKVEIYLLYLKLCIHPNINETKSFPFSIGDTIKKIQNKIMELFEVSNDNETRVWRQQRYMFNTYEHLSNEDQTLADAGIFGEQLIMLEMKDKHGHWPRGELINNIQQSSTQKPFTNDKPPQEPAANSKSKGKVAAKGESLPNVHYKYKPGDRVVLHSIHNVPIYGTVRWTGQVIVNKAPITTVGVETDKIINIERDLLDTHLKVTDDHGHELFKVALDHSRVFVPELLVVHEYEYTEQKKDDEIRIEQKLAIEYGIITVEEYQAQKALLNQAKEDLFAIGSMVVIPTQGPNPLKGVVKWIGTLPEISGLIAGVELDTEYAGCTDGTWKGRRFFKCPNGRGYFGPLRSLQNFPEQQDVQVYTGYTDQMKKDDVTKKLSNNDLAQKALLDQARGEKLKLEWEKQKLEEKNELLIRENTILKEEREEERRTLNDKCFEIENLTREKRAFQIENQRSKYAEDELLRLNHQLKEENKIIRAQYEHEKNNSNHLQSNIARLSIENMRLKGQVKLLEDDNTVNDINYWEISYKQVKTNQEVLGRGGWGQVLVGLFQGQKFALKMLHSEIVSPYYNQLVHREISMMAKVRHPNLILFVGAILDHPSGSPIIITELLDTSLRKAYKDCLLRDDGVKLCILRDVGAALNYLHCHKDSIIHRDVSSANVLLESKGNGKWKGKLSDFGSANLMQYATTAGPGAQVYAAPEVPQVQTTKMDVYSYGILMCEVMTCQFPFPQSFPDMVMSLGSKWSPLHQLVLACTKELPDDRPHMDYTLQSLYTHYNDLLLMEITQFNNCII